MHTKLTCDGEILCHGLHEQHDSKLSISLTTRDGTLASKSSEVLTFNDEQNTPSKPSKVISETETMPSEPALIMSQGPTFSPSISAKAHIEDSFRTPALTATSSHTTRALEREMIDESQVEVRASKPFSQTHKTIRDPRLPGYLHLHDGKESAFISLVSEVGNISELKPPNEFSSIEEDSNTSSFFVASENIDMPSVKLSDLTTADALVTSVVEIPRSQPSTNPKGAGFPPGSHDPHTILKPASAQKGSAEDADVVEASGTRRQEETAISDLKPADTSRDGDTDVTGFAMDRLVAGISGGNNTMPGKEAAAPVKNVRIASKLPDLEWTKEAPASNHSFECLQNEQVSKEDKRMIDTTASQEVPTDVVWEASDIQQEVAPVSGEDKMDCDPDKQSFEMDDSCKSSPIQSDTGNVLVLTAIRSTSLDTPTCLEQRLSQKLTPGKHNLAAVKQAFQPPPQDLSQKPQSSVIGGDTKPSLRNAIVDSGSPCPMVIDGTEIQAYIPKEQETPYRVQGSKSSLKTNPAKSMQSRRSNVDGDQSFHLRKISSVSNGPDGFCTDNYGSSSEEAFKSCKKRSNAVKPYRPSKKQKTIKQSVISISDNSDDPSSPEDFSEVEEAAVVKINNKERNSSHARFGAPEEANERADQSQSPNDLKPEIHQLPSPKTLPPMEYQEPQAQKKPRGKGLGKPAIEQNLSRSRKSSVRGQAGSAQNVNNQELPEYDAVCKKILPSTGSFPRYPRSQNGDVYIEIAHENTEYSFSINRATLEKSSAWFKKTLYHSVAEYDKVLSREIMARTGKVARYELRWSLENKRWILQNAPFTEAKAQQRAGAPLLICRAFENLLKIYCGLPPGINTSNVDDALRDFELLCRLAQRYGNIQQVILSLLPILGSLGSSLYEAILRNPVSWLELSLSLHAKAIFKEAVVHLVGLWPHWPSQVTRFNQLPRPVRDLIIGKSEKLRLLKADVDEELFMASFKFEGCTHDLCLGPIDKDGFDVWFIVQLWRDWFARTLKHYYQGPRNYHGVGRIYREISRGGDTYLPLSSVLDLLENYKGPDFALWEPKSVENALNEMKNDAQRFVKDLVVNRSMLDPEKHKISHLTCTTVSDAELPWVFK